MKERTQINDRVRELLIEHCKSYLMLEEHDVFKYLYQSSFGCEHMVSDENAALDFIKREYSSLQISCSDSRKTEPLAGNYSRVSLSCIQDGLKPETLAKLFSLSAKKEPDGKILLEQSLEIAKELVSVGLLPFRHDRFCKKLDKWRAAGYPAIHHSDAFRSHYSPSYRVISKTFADFLQLFTEIDRLSQKDFSVIAIEGGSASGKTTLAQTLCQVYDCNVFHMDDFFLRPEQRTSKRLEEVGGNIDRERFLEEVLIPLKKNDTVRYKRFDCATQSLCDTVTVTPKKLTVVEGVYSIHPAFSRYYNLSLFLDIASDCQKKRITNRNSPELAIRFFNEWIPMENKYFSATDIKERSDLIIRIDS